jgi:hypothetical protein
METDVVDLDVVRDAHGRIKKLSVPRDLEQRAALDRVVVSLTKLTGAVAAHVAQEDRRRLELAAAQAAGETRRLAGQLFDAIVRRAADVRRRDAERTAATRLWERTRHAIWGSPLRANEEFVATVPRGTDLALLRDVAAADTAFWAASDRPRRIAFTFAPPRSFSIAHGGRSPIAGVAGGGRWYA